MDNLRILQNAFQAQLLGESLAFQNQVVKTKQPSTKERIGLYADGYTARLFEALNDNYSQLAQYMGENKFYLMAQKYIITHPSNFRSIRWFGNLLPNFLQEQYKKRPILAEIAKFEWAIGETFDATNAENITISDLKNIPPDLWANMKFTFNPSVQYHNFGYNVISIWDALLNKKTKRASKRKLPQTVLFWRQDLKTFYRPLPEIDALALIHAFNGASFAEICEGICQWMDEKQAAIQAATLVIQWLSAGLISHILV